MRSSEAILNFLENLGITQLFGIVGREAASILFDECDAVEFVPTRHEFAAGIIAIALSRFAGSPQACFVTLGPGVTHIASAIATAMADRYPLLVIAAQIETSQNNFNWAHQCIDAAGVAQPIAKYSVQIDDVADLLPCLRTAAEKIMEQPWGPALVVVPIDILRCEVAWPAPTTEHRSVTTVANVEPLIEHSIKALRSSESPMIVVGEEVAKSGLAYDVRELSSRYGIPVVTTYGAKGTLRADDPLNFGALTPYTDTLLRYPALDEIFGSVDYLLLLGYDLSEYLLPETWTRGKSKEIIRLGSYENMTPQTLCPSIDVVTPLKSSLAALLENLGQSFEPRAIDGVRARMSDMECESAEDGSGLLPHQILHVLNEHYDDYILASDVGRYRHGAAVFFRANEPLDFLTSGGLSSFGTGLPMGIGAKLARRNRNVVVLSGDVGFHSSSCDLETAARLGLKMTILVLDNQRSGLIERYQLTGMGRRNPIPISYGRVDFVRLAEANGCNGIRAESIADLEYALRLSDQHPGPTVIQLPVRYDSAY